MEIVSGKNTLFFMPPLYVTRINILFGFVIVGRFSGIQKPNAHIAARGVFVFVA